MSQIWGGVVAVLMAIIGVAILSVLLSNKSNTVNVLNAGSSAFSGALGTAISPITGGSLNMGLNTGYSTSVV